MTVYTREQGSRHGVAKRMSFKLWTALALGLALGFVRAGMAAEAVEAPKLVPTPKSVTAEKGTMPLTAKSRIVAADASLKPLASILADEIRLITGLELETANGEGRPGDIVLKINPQIRADEDILAVQYTGIGTIGLPGKIARTRDFAHTIKIGDMAVVEGWDYRAVCEGTATILQAIAEKDGEHFLPQMTVKDWPHADYTGVMVDVARQRIPIDSLKAVIEACRLWKIRYCQLHLTDNEGFTFPSAAFPKLGSKNTAMHDGVVPKVYDLKELRDLVAFADARGVTLVPELATPCHSEAMCRAMPELFAGPKIMNIVSDEMYKSLDTLVGEMCDVFKSSPYFHIGGDEMYLFEIDEQQKTKDYIKQKGMKSLDDVLVQHVMRMNGIVRKHGKTTLAWEGIATGAEGRSWTLPAPAKDEIILMCWIPYPTTDGLQKQGFTTITVPWDLGAPLPEWNIYISNGCRLNPAANRVLGAAQTMWQMSPSALVGDHLGGDVNGSSTEGYIRSLCERMERTWEPTRKMDEGEYKQRLANTRALLDQLVLPVKIEGGPIAYRGWPVLGRMYCGGPVEIKLSLAKGVGGGEIRYTLDGSEPTPASTVYSAPFKVDETTAVNAALFRNGRQVGYVSRSIYDNGKPQKPRAKAE